METPSPPRISPISRLVAWLSWALLFPIAWLLVDLTILSAGAPGPSRPDGWSWLAFSLVNVGYLAVTIFMARLVIAPFLVSLSADGIDFITVRGRRHLAWLSIADARVRGNVVTLRGGGHTVRLNEYCYTQPALLLSFLKDVLPRELRSRVAV
jgi:hypothetical protein